MNVPLQYSEEGSEEIVRIVTIRKVYKTKTPWGRDSWYTMTDAEFRSAVASIVKSSSSGEEVQRRIRKELKYPYDVNLHTITLGTSAESLAQDLGVIAIRGRVMTSFRLRGQKSGIVI